MGRQRDLGLSAVPQLYQLEMSQAECDQGGGVESPESFWGTVGISGWSQEGFLEEAAVNKDKEEFACQSCAGRTFQAEGRA